MRDVMGGVVWVGGGGCRCRVWGPVMGSLVAVACVGGGIDVNWLVLAAACCVRGLVSGGGVVWGLHCWWLGGWGWVLCWLGDGRPCGSCGCCVCAPCGPCGS